MPHVAKQPQSCVTGLGESEPDAFSTPAGSADREEDLKRNPELSEGVPGPVKCGAPKVETANFCE